MPGSALRAPVDSELADQLGFGGRRRRVERELPEPMLLDPRRMFYAPSYEQAIEHLRELYRADGFLEVKIDDVEARARSTSQPTWPRSSRSTRGRAPSSTTSVSRTTSS